MKKSKVKIVVKPHYIGTEQCGKVFRRVIVAEVQRKINLQNISTKNAK